LSQLYHCQHFIDYAATPAIAIAPTLLSRQIDAIFISHIDEYAAFIAITNTFWIFSLAIDAIFIVLSIIYIAIDIFINANSITFNTLLLEIIFFAIDYSLRQSAITAIIDTIHYRRHWLFIFASFALLRQ